MTKYFVTVGVFDTIEVDAASQEDAELLAVELFDPTANDPYVHDSWEVESEEMLDALIAEHEEDERVKELENFDPITHIEHQEQTGEL